MKWNLNWKTAVLKTKRRLVRAEQPDERFGIIAASANNPYANAFHGDSCAFFVDFVCLLLWFKFNSLYLQLKHLPYVEYL